MTSRKSKEPESVPSTAVYAASEINPNAVGVSLATRPSSGLVRPVVDAEEAKAEWNRYVELCNAILNEGDFIYYVHYKNKAGDEEKPVAFLSRKEAEAKVKFLQSVSMQSIVIRDRKRRSAWDKLARYFGLSLPQLGDFRASPAQELGNFIIETKVGQAFMVTTYLNKDTLQIVKASATVAVTAPNGRTAIGEGICSIGERKNKADSFAHADHDIPTTAFTRALNRAISRCIGTGEVSAEEMGSAPEVEVEKSQPVETVVRKGDVEAALPTTPTTLVPSPPQGSVVPPNAGVPSAPSTDSGAPAKFSPIQGSVPDRIRHLEAWVYGDKPRDSLRANQLVRYAIFLVPTAVKADIESHGRWDSKKWKEAMKGLGAEAYTNRVGLLEDYAAAVRPAMFLEWATSGVNAIFGKEQ